MDYTRRKDGRVTVSHGPRGHITGRRGPDATFIVLEFFVEDLQGPGMPGFLKAAMKTLGRNFDRIRLDPGANAFLRSYLRTWMGFEGGERGPLERPLPRTVFPGPKYIGDPMDLDEMREMRVLEKGFEASVLGLSREVMKRALVELSYLLTWEELEGFFSVADPSVIVGVLRRNGTLQLLPGEFRATPGFERYMQLFFARYGPFLLDQRKALVVTQEEERRKGDPNDPWVEKTRLLLTLSAEQSVTIILKDDFRVPNFDDVWDPELRHQLPHVAFMHGDPPMERLLLGRYEVKAYRRDTLIGGGSYGAVYRGVDNETGARVAVKVVRIEEVGNVALSVHQELLAAQRLRHPNIVTFLGYDRAENHAYFIYELMDGSLESLILHPPRDLPVRDIMRQILEGLAYMHSQGYLHLDLRSVNVLFRWRPGERIEVKLADFGISRFVGRGEQFHVRTPTRPWAWTTDWYMRHQPHYIAPEQIAYEFFEEAMLTEVPPALWSRVDMWMLGMLFYSLLTGRPNRKPMVGPWRQPAGSRWISHLEITCAWAERLGPPTDEQIMATPHPARKILIYIRRRWGSDVCRQFLAGRVDDGAPPVRFPLLEELRQANVPYVATGLLARMFRYLPGDRVPAALALKHPYFGGSPMREAPPSPLPTIPPLPPRRYE